MWGGGVQAEQRQREFLEASRAISPFVEMGAYEALWLEEGASFKSLADRFRAEPQAVPSDFVDEREAVQRAREVLSIFDKAGLRAFGVRVHGAGDYPPRLRDARHPVELLYYRGWWELASTRGVAIVGTRKPSEEGRRRAAQLARQLVRHDITVVSGLAAGIDAVAHRAAIHAGGRTIAVIGTPIHRAYPSENRELQDEIASDYLLISQTPVLYHEPRPPVVTRFFFPERNVTMSALSEATIIVEAGNTSGTLTQARAALAQGRKLFILDSCFRDASLTWPKTYEARGALRVRSFDDVARVLGL